MKRYDNNKYYEMADKANELKQKLYILLTQEEFERQVFEYEKKEVEVPIYDEEGEIIGYETILVDDLDKPIMVIDEETGELVHKYHIEKYLETVEDLVIANDGYYICFDENKTNGEINENIEVYNHERAKNLTCTKRVFALMLKELGVKYSQLEELIATNEDAKLEWDLCVELLRNNPMLDLMAIQLGITSEQLDKLFLYANDLITLDEFKGGEVNVDN